MSCRKVVFTDSSLIGRCALSVQRTGQNTETAILVIGHTAYAAESKVYIFVTCWTFLRTFQMSVLRLHIEDILHLSQFPASRSIQPKGWSFGFGPAVVFKQTQSLLNNAFVIPLPIWKHRIYDLTYHNHSAIERVLCFSFSSWKLLPNRALRAILYSSKNF